MSGLSLFPYMSASLNGLDPTLVDHPDISILLSLHFWLYDTHKQVLSVKKVGTGETDRYRAIISDGQCFIQAMFATALNDRILGEEVQRNCVVRLDGYTVNAVKDKT